MYDFWQARTNMVENQILAGGVSALDVAYAFGVIPRELFLPENLRYMAYVDNDIFINDKRFMLEPLVFAKLLEFAEIGKDDLVLDVACGSGYTTALMSILSNMVIGVDSCPDMEKFATATLSALAIDNAVVVTGDLKRGLDKHGPYDLIMIAGAVNKISEDFLGQLANKGKLVTFLSTDSKNINGYVYAKATKITKKGRLFTTDEGFEILVPPLIN